MIQETNRVASMTGLESLIRKEIDTTFLSKRIWDADDILKHPLDWYKGFVGSNFNNRIDRRRAIVKNEINQAIRNAFVQGSSVDRCTKDVLDRLNVSYSNAKRLTHNELTYAQHCADSRQMKENGFKGVKRKTVKDSHVCKICKEREGEIIPIEEYEKNPNVFMLHVNDRCYGVPVMSLDGNSSFRKFAEKYDKEQAKK
jgi:SPP1 gp7 family putative phage head morphogenesis protein